MRIEVARGDAHPRHVDVSVPITLPVLGGDRKRVVRVSQRDHHAEGPGVVVPGHVEQLAFRPKHDLVVEIDLVRADAGPRLGHRVHGVIPARPMLEVEPVGGPAEIGRVDIGRQALLEAMQLIGAAEVHLPAQHGAIPRESEVMRKRGQLRREFRRVVVCTDGRGQTSGHEREARGRTQRTVAVCGSKRDAAGCQGVEVRCSGHRISIRRECARSQLVSHEYEEIGLWHEHPSVSGSWAGIHDRE